MGYRRRVKGEGREGGRGKGRRRGEERKKEKTRQSVCGPHLAALGSSNKIVCVLVRDCLYP